MKIIGNLIIWTLLCLPVTIKLTLVDGKLVLLEDMTSHPDIEHDVTKASQNDDSIAEVENTSLHQAVNARPISVSFPPSEHQPITSSPQTTTMYYDVIPTFSPETSASQIIDIAGTSYLSNTHGHLSTPSHNLETTTDYLASEYTSIATEQGSTATRDTLATKYASNATAQETVATKQDSIVTKYNILAANQGSLAATKRIACSDTNGWGLWGTEWGCCGSYEDCCIYASLVCYIHDAMCRCCDVGGDFCGPRCQPERDCKNEQNSTNSTPAFESSTPALSQSPLDEEKTSSVLNVNDVITRANAINMETTFIGDTTTNTVFNFDSTIDWFHQYLFQRGKDKESDSDNNGFEQSGETEFIAEL